MIPPPPKGAPAAVQELVLSINQKKFLHADNPGLSPSGSPQRRGGAPGASAPIFFLKKESTKKRTLYFTIRSGGVIFPPTCSESEPQWDFPLFP